jgi:hypothetical protein
VNYLDFTSLLDGDSAYLALFSTFMFEPDFFERRLLKCSALRKARRIAVFMDAGQWQSLIQSDAASRWVNRRYLAVPVRRDQGVFHPKLSLVLTEKGGQVLCGSNNLTRSGCSSNLELLNAIPFEFSEDEIKGTYLAHEVLRFFRRASEDTDQEIGRIVHQWLEEAESRYPWGSVAHDEEPSVRLVHTYSGSIWEQISEQISRSDPSEFFVVSPFHDVENGTCRQLADRWPNAKIELLVQQGYTNLQAPKLSKLKTVRMSEIQEVPRRLHAKLFAWRGKAGSGCLAGSANFTSAAFQGRNVEAGLLIEKALSSVERLFDDDLSKRAISLDDFEPSDKRSPEDEPWTTPLISVSSAVLDERGRLTVSFRHCLSEQITSLRVALRTPGEKEPRVSIPVHAASHGTVEVVPPEDKLSDVHGTLLAGLIAEVSGERIESPPVWIIQEGRLTYEAGEGSSSPKGRIEETGEGLPEYLDEIGHRQGVAAIAEALAHLNIRFHDGLGGLWGRRKFRVRIADPFESDRTPDWLIQGKAESADLQEAIQNFVERHDRQKLRKHARRGNINGMDNFLDILTSLVRVQYIWLKRSDNATQRVYVKRSYLIKWLCDWIDLATSGRDSEEDSFDGYLYSLWDSLSGDRTTLGKVCEDHHYGAEVRAILQIAQKLRYVPGEIPMNGKPPHSQRDVLKAQAATITDCFASCELDGPSREEVTTALERYRMFSAHEIGQMLDAL